MRTAAAVALASALSVVVLTSRAQAYGAVFSSADQPLTQTAAKVLLIPKEGGELTAVVAFELEGPPQPFAWLLPVPASPSVEVSSTTLFDRITTATTPEYWVEVVRGEACPSIPDGGAEESPYDPYDPQADGGAGYPPGLDLGQIGGGAPGQGPRLPMIKLKSHEVLEINDELTDPVEAVVDWLKSEGLDAGSFDRDAWQTYLAQGYRVLAVRYESSEARGTTQPLVVTYAAEEPALPWRVTAAAAADDMPVSLWVLGTAQAVSASHPSLVLNDALLNWQTARPYKSGTLPAAGSGPLYGVHFDPPDNYAELIAAAVSETEDGGFVTEVALPASDVRAVLWSPVEEDGYRVVGDRSFEDGFDLLARLGPSFGTWEGFREAVAAASTLPAEVTLDQFMADPEAYRGAVTIDADRLVSLVDEQVIKPVYDVAQLLFEAPYLTRFASVLTADAAPRDASFLFNADLALNRGVHFARKTLECAEGQEPDEAPWRYDLPQGGVVLGSGNDWPLAIGSLPATLKVVALSEDGSGEVLEDHSAEIGSALFDAAGTTGSGAALPHPPTSGVLIGATQSILPEPDFDAGVSDAMRARSGESGCSLTGGQRTVGSGSLWALLLMLGMRLCTRSRRALLLLAMVWAVACGGDGRSAKPADDAGVESAMGALTREQLRDPQACKDCHPRHFREWSASMHAYAAKDPVFLAMNRRGQRETKGELGTFCVNCHAPMAVADGLTKDGLNLEQLPDFERGVSCYFCHNAMGVEDDHNGKLVVANDRTMRGPIENPLQPSAHRAEFSTLLKGRSYESTKMCGGCHDIVMPNGVHLERTFQEYRHGVYSKTATGGEPEPFDSCAGCHMPPSTGYAAEVKGAPLREVHEHLWPGIDVALIDDFPHREAMRSAVEDCQLGVASITHFTLEVTPPDLFTFLIETGAGHNQPSGASQDRRMWIEFRAYDAQGELIKEVSSGLIEDGEIEEKAEGEAGYDPRLVMFRDYIYKANGEPAHMFWDAAKSVEYPLGYKSQLLPVASSTYAEGGHALLKQYRAATADGSLPARVTARLKIRPIGQDVLQDLVASGDLEADVAARMPTFTFGAAIDWTPKDGVKRTIRAEVNSDCESYVCMLTPEKEGCK